MPRPPRFDPSRLDDTAPAFRHEGLPTLLLRALVFWGMGRRRLSRLVERVLLANVGNPLGRALASVSAQLFMGGDTLDDCRAVLTHLGKYQAMGILDYLVEGDESPAGRDATRDTILETLDFAALNGVPYAACKPSGLMDLPVLAKVQTRAPLTPDERREYDAGVARLDALCARAAARGVRLFVDAEWVYMQAAADEIVLEMMRRYNRERPVVYTTLQMYRTDRLAYLEHLLGLSADEGWTLALKLVRGAYMDFEREKNPIDPIHPTVEATHRAYDAGLDRCLDALGHCAVVVATHNRRSVGHALAGLAARGIPLEDPRVEFAQLLGMSDMLTYNVAAMGAQGYKYIPWGPIDEAVPYLIRRADENKSLGDETTRELAAVLREIRRRIRG